MTADRRNGKGERRTAGRPRGGRRITDLESHDQPWLSITQVAAYLQVSRWTVYKFIAAKHLVAIKLPTGQIRVKRISLKQFEETQRLRPSA